MYKRQGFDFTLLDSSTELTPQQAASRLKMSRTHLYKLLESGAVSYTHLDVYKRQPFSDRGGVDGAVRELGPDTESILDALNRELTA